MGDSDRATHLSTGATWRFLCTPVASHLNHDGKANGITRVIRWPEGDLTDVGTRTLRRIRYVVRTFDNTAWHSNGVTGDSLFSTQSEAERFLAVTVKRQRPGQSALIIVELVQALVQSTSGGKLHLSAGEGAGITFPRCAKSRTARGTSYRFVRHLGANVTCELCKKLGNGDHADA